MEKLKICTFNLRVISEHDGINIFHNRKDRILSAINEHSPDIIGFQEALDPMREFLRGSLKEYTLIGCGRNADYRGEGVPIAFKTDKFELIRHECFWLSPTPDVPGSRYEDQSQCPRVSTAVLLSPREGEPFWFINTHLDHKSSSARVLGANHLVKYILGLKENFVLTGDFNAGPESDEIAVITSNNRIKNATKNIGGTFHGFGRISTETMRQIDYIFTDMEISEAFAIQDEPQSGIYISDHRPVIACVEK